MSSLSSLAIKMFVTAAVVVIATTIAERTRPVVAALIATLPLSVGAAYVMVSLDHDAAFVAAAALKGIGAAAATTAFIAAYAIAASRSFGPGAALTAGYLAWSPLTFAVHEIEWRMSGVLLFTAVVMSACQLATRQLRGLKATRPSRRFWYDPFVRAGAVALLVGLLSAFASRLGPSGVGALANFPIIMSSVGVILHRRMGPDAAAGMLSNSVPGMVGVCLALLQLHFTIEAWGAAISLSVGLAICIAWNLMLYRLSRR